MKTRIVDCHKEGFEVYIGRGSKWGNPFKIGEDGTREEVIEKYRHYFLTELRHKVDLEELRGKVLGCFCHPKPCHGDILIEYLERTEDHFD